MFWFLRIFLNPVSLFYIMEKIIVVDFAGTLIKPEIIEEANKYRAEILAKALPSEEEHANPEELYKVNREFVEKLIGIKSDAKIKYRENDLDNIELSGEQLQNQIATNLFQIGMYIAAKKYKENIFPEGLIDELKKIKQKYALAIVSGVRTDIISGMLLIAGCDLFDYIYGQPPILGVTNEQNFKELKQKGEIIFLMGDKYSDLEPAKKLNAKTIFVRWGHASGGEEEIADFTIEKPEEISKIIN